MMLNKNIQFKLRFSSYYTYISIIIFSLLFIICAGKSNSEVKKIRVGIINNDRLPKLEYKQIKSVLDNIKNGVKSRFDIELKYSPLMYESLESFFKRYINRVSKDSLYLFEKHILRVNDTITHQSEYIRFKEEYIKSFNEMKAETIRDAIVNQGFKHDRFGLTKTEMLSNVVDYHIKKISSMANITLKDGKKLLDSKDSYHEFMMWNSIVETQSDYDLIITNQLIASAESYLPTIHSSLRGGVTSGAALKSNTHLNGLVIVTTYPFISKKEFFKKERDENFTIKEAINYIALIGIHEFGHLLKYRPHYYNHPSCVMRPAPGLKYKAWYNEVTKTHKCTKEHSEY